MRKALELSITTQSAFAAMGAYSFEMLPPALNSAMSTPPNESAVTSLTVISSPRNFSFLPTERAEASNVSFPTGKLRFSKVWIISIANGASGADHGYMRFMVHKLESVIYERAAHKCQSSSAFRQQFSL